MKSVAKRSSEEIAEILRLLEVSAEQSSEIQSESDDMPIDLDDNEESDNALKPPLHITFIHNLMELRKDITSKEISVFLSKKGHHISPAFIAYIKGSITRSKNKQRASLNEGNK